MLENLFLEAIRHNVTEIVIKRTDSNAISRDDIGSRSFFHPYFQSEAKGHCK